jgi:CheY-like chemotaxis protein
VCSSDLIIKAGNRASDLVKQILTFSRPSDIELSVMDVQPVIKEVLKLLSASHPPTVHIKTVLQAEKSLILASPTHIYQLLMNLTTNAVQSLPNAKGEIEIRLANIDFIAPMPVGLESLTSGKYLEIAVADNGCGMNEDTLRKIFDPYFSTKAPGKGTGLGMSVVHGIIKQLHGAITVESEVSKGSVVHVFLPAENEAGHAPEQTGHGLPCGNEKVLLIDDNPQLVDISEQMLQVLGYSVTVFTDGNAAIDAFRERPDAFQLVLSDMLMPTITGLDLCQAIKAIRPATPVIIFTGNPNNISKAEMNQAGISRVLHKPLKLDELAVVIRSCLDKDTFDIGSLASVTE